MPTLRRMREVCQRRGVRRLNAVATAAVREAENGEEFADLVREELEIPLRIIDGEPGSELSAIGRWPTISSWREAARSSRTSAAAAWS